MEQHYLRGLFLGLVLLLALQIAEAGLSPNYYETSCPNVESIVRQAVEKKKNATVVTVPATLRLFFHDCFVEGCDASVLIASPNGDAEKDAPDNISLAGDGFDTVIKAKEAVEAECPGVVSCADILAIAARDVVALAGGPNFTVELGRLDGLISNASLLDVPGRPIVQPCVRGAAQAGVPAARRSHDGGEHGPVTPITFDSYYYKNLVDGLGLFRSDEVLYTDNRTKSAVDDFAGNQSSFFAAFAHAMVKLGRVGVKAGKLGQIRRDCTTFN
uniref:peroxidase n=1 Tax=Ananas comosus var. bracteatus TaxID=296719 RepID=A0A6V7QSG1_ANACO